MIFIYFWCIVCTLLLECSQTSCISQLFSIFCHPSIASTWSCVAICCCEAASAVYFCQDLLQQLLGVRCCSGLGKTCKIGNVCIICTDIWQKSCKQKHGHSKQPYCLVRYRVFIKYCFFSRIFNILRPLPGLLWVVQKTASQEWMYTEFSDKISCSPTFRG